MRFVFRPQLKRERTKRITCPLIAGLITGTDVVKKNRRSPYFNKIWSYTTALYLKRTSSLSLYALICARWAASRMSLCRWVLREIFHCLNIGLKLEFTHWRFDFLLRKHRTRSIVPPSLSGNQAYTLIYCTSWRPLLRLRLACSHITGDSPGIWFVTWPACTVQCCTVSSKNTFRFHLCIVAVGVDGTWLEGTLPNWWLGGLV